MPTINETVTASLRAAGLGNYASQATPVVNALIEREQRIYTGVMEAATSAGLNPRNVQSLLSELGMASPSVQREGAMYAEPTDPGPTTMASTMTEADTIDPTTDLLRRVQNLEGFARNYGFTS
jgi:hypothetical protein